MRKEGKDSARMTNRWTCGSTETCVSPRFGCTEMYMMSCYVLLSFIYSLVAETFLMPNSFCEARHAFIFLDLSLLVTRFS